MAGRTIAKAQLKVISNFGRVRNVDRIGLFG